MFTIDPHSSRRLPAGQCSLQPWLVRAFAGLCLMFFAGGLAGCKSIYEQTRSALPPEPDAELRLRMDEARRAENTVEQAGQKLQRDLKHALSNDVIQVDFDRLEAVAFELERRALAARESLARCVETTESAKQIESLQRRATAWLEYIQANRHADADTQSRRLASLLLDPPSNR